MSKIFEPLTLRGITLRNRYALSPMCQYTGPWAPMADAAANGRRD